MEIGLHKNVPFETYRSWPEINNSALGCLAPPDGCPALLDHELQHPSPSTKPMKLGRAMHTLTLEGSKVYEQFMKFGQCQLPTKKGERCSRSAVATADGLQVCEQHLNDRPNEETREPLNEEEWSKVRGMRDGILGKAAAMRFLNMPGNVELSGVFVDIDTGVRCKMRIDKLIQGKIDGQPFVAVLDLKKTAKAVSREQLKYTIRNYGYDRQAAFYLHGLAALQIYAEHFIFVFVKEEPPHLVTVGRIKERALEKARRQIVEDLITYKECRESGLWPDYGSEIVTLDVPDYEYRKEQA